MHNGDRIEIIIKTKNAIEQDKIGKHICNQLVGNPDFIDDNILVNYTDDTNSVYIIVGEEAKETALNLIL